MDFREGGIRMSTDLQCIFQYSTDPRNAHTLKFRLFFLFFFTIAQVMTLFSPQFYGAKIAHEKLNEKEKSPLHRIARPPMSSSVGSNFLLPPPLIMEETLRGNPFGRNEE